MADSPVRNNSPDETKYHSNVSGVAGTMLPRAGSEGKSLAFDANKPQVVIVDPGEDGGGFSLDLAQLSQSQSRSRFNSAAVRSEVLQDPSKFLKGLSEATAEEDRSALAAKAVHISHNPVQEQVSMSDAKPTEGPRSLPPINPLPTLEPKPEAPTAETGGYRLQASTDVSDEIRRQLQEESERPAMLQLEQRRSVESAHRLNELSQQMIAQGAAINSLIASFNQMNEKSREPPVAVEKSWEPPEEAVEATLSELASLNIEFLQEGGPRRPQYETYFEMAKMGTMAARYHAVVSGRDCLALIYDTRFEDGFQYLPPNLGEAEITVSVPKLGDAVYTCSSLGLHWTLGCLDIIILIKINKGTEA
jgi:hypothetical protein